MIREVVITGLGRVGPEGAGRAALARALREGAPVPISPFDTHESLAVSEDHSGEPPAQVARVSEGAASLPDGRARADERGQAETIVRAAARLARSEAKLQGTAPAGELWVATSFGVPASRRALGEVVDPEEVERWVRATGTERLGGELVAREASGLLALTAAARAVAEGRIDRAVVVEVDAFGPALLRVHRRLRALASAVGGVAPVARPFDPHRRGTVLAEGATALVLERDATARERQVHPRSRIGFAYQGFDESAPPYGFGCGGTRLGVELRDRLAEAGIPLSTIEGVIAGARGSLEGDAQEAAWIVALFSPGPPPPVFAPIGATGLGGGGFLAAAALAAEGLSLGDSAGFCRRDSNSAVLPHPGSIFPARGRILVSTIASGGRAAWVLLEAP